jgi:hypothetical protein
MPAVSAGAFISGELCHLLRREALKLSDNAPPRLQADIVGILEAANAWLLRNDAAYTTVSGYAIAHNISEKTVYRSLKAGDITGARKGKRSWRLPMSGNN